MPIFLCAFHVVESWSKNALAKWDGRSQEDKLLRDQAIAALCSIQRLVYTGPPPSSEQLPSVQKQLDDQVKLLLQQFYTTYAGQPAFVAYVPKQWGHNYRKQHCNHALSIRIWIGTVHSWLWCAMWL